MWLDTIALIHYAWITCSLPPGGGAERGAGIPLGGDLQQRDAHRRVAVRAVGGDAHSYGATPTMYRYTGQWEEASLGLYFYGRYAYALNNSMRKAPKPLPKPPTGGTTPEGSM